MTRWILVVLLWLGFAVVSFGAVERTDFGGGDFHIYYHAAKDYLPAHMPYLTVVDDLHDSLPYPPFLAQLVIPIARALNITWATRLWFAISLSALIGMLAVLSRFLPPRQRPALWIFAVFFAPIFEALRVGQVNILLMVLIALAWVCIKDERPTLGGILLAITAWIKIYPALILVYFVWKRDWRVVRGGIIGGIAVALFQIVISGVDLLVEFFQSLFLLAGQGDPALIWKNNSIFGFTAKLFLTYERVEPLIVSPVLFTLTRFGLLALALGGLMMLTKGRVATYDQRFDLEYALVVLTTLLISPWLHSDTFALGFITLFILWYGVSNRRHRLLIIVAVVLIIGNYLLIWQPGSTFNALLLSLGFYALAILWIVNVSLLVRAGAGREWSEIEPAPQPTDSGKAI